MHPKPEDAHPLPWPLFTIDFEASSLDAGTYPIEVGICRWSSPDRPIEGWSTLIQPLPEWDRHGSWSPVSQEVHGIDREQIDAGLTPTDTICALNAILDGRPAYCDGGSYDVHWARMLASGSGVRPTFAIGDFDHLAVLCDQIGYMRLVRWLDRAPARHRARDDAERLMKALARGLGLEHGTSVDIVIPARGEAIRTMTGDEENAGSRSR